MITDEQYDIISSRIENSNITLTSLKEDIAEHFCCVIEKLLDEGYNFEDAYKMAFNQVCPNGFDEIQTETIFLLNYSKYILMKGITYLLGLLASIAISVGLVFRILQWPGSYHMLAYGMILFTLIFLPMQGFNQMKNFFNKNFNSKAKIILGFLSAFLLGVSVIFEVLHLQFSNILLLLSGIIFSFGFLPLLFWGIYKKEISSKEPSKF